MKKSNVTSTLTLAVMLLVTLSLQAQADRGQRRGGERQQPSVEQIMKDLDANDDGKISKKEAKGPLEKFFSKVDTNEDGFITKEELEKAPKPKGNRSQGNNRNSKRDAKKAQSPEEVFKTLDVNKDGKISKDEAKGPIKTHFDKIDVNGDGFIIQDELEITSNSLKKE